MAYWVYRDSSNHIVSFNIADTITSPFAEMVTKEQFLDFGGRVEDFPKLSPMPTTEELQKETNLLKAQLKAQTESSTFLEDCIAEMALQVYK